MLDGGIFRLDEGPFFVDESNRLERLFKNRLDERATVRLDERAVARLDDRAVARLDGGPFFVEEKNSPSGPFVLVFVDSLSISVLWIGSSDTKMTSSSRLRLLSWIRGLRKFCNSISNEVSGLESSKPFAANADEIVESDFARTAGTKDALVDALVDELELLVVDDVAVVMDEVDRSSCDEYLWG